MVRCPVTLGYHSPSLKLQTELKLKPSTKHPRKVVLLLRQRFLLVKVSQAHSFLPAFYKVYPDWSWTLPRGGGATHIHQHLQLNRVNNFSWKSESAKVYYCGRHFIRISKHWLHLVPISQKAMESSWKTINGHMFPLFAPTTSQHKKTYSITHAAFLLGAVFPLMPVMVSVVFNWPRSIC